jgi:23S rRNA G2445 N2-methylase RlmL
MFVLAQPGLAGLVKRELGSLPAVSKVTDLGNDGRSDVVLCDVAPGQERSLTRLRLVEDVFVELGRTLRSEGDKPHWIAARLWRPARATRAVQVWRSVTSTRGGVTYRVVARVLQERAFQRTDLRRALVSVVGKAERGWRLEDPAKLELWALEYQRGKLIAGVRLSGAGMRQHGGRESERSGALRPTVAAAMVSLAGDGDGGRTGAGGVLLDPCCGSGTILTEARAAGWQVEGRDLDAAAVGVARRNVGSGTISQGDARSLDLPSASVDACVSNLPFGRQFAVQGESGEWFRHVLGELARVTRPSGRVVLLVPELPRESRPSVLRLVDRYPLRLLGAPTTIWNLERRPD